eukprot:767597-Hanusia_phi.AAC.9
MAVCDYPRLFQTRPNPPSATPRYYRTFYFTHPWSRQGHTPYPLMEVSTPALQTILLPLYPTCFLIIGPPRSPTLNFKFDAAEAPAASPLI